MHTIVRLKQKETSFAVILNKMAEHLESELGWDERKRENFYANLKTCMTRKSKIMVAKLTL